ncbi:hypothetical protein TVAG_081480 [Trichomonas vaginalis G3]|uniref:DUF3447 domain-containing protein n=1 Tax=Trichomonas vaginalis (strain ATCC PRA-98 / G3) TaxID=412133 RepID=A2E6U0_TRIV3|nr:hypothetical protein TVAG_081480 [Trichomonas vaginalis G3]|eukprot:XP_001323799.1 hypothetical protein [Trichomonas vaginalis G3]
MVLMDIGRKLWQLGSSFIRLILHTYTWFKRNAGYEVLERKYNYAEFMEENINYVNAFDKLYKINSWNVEEIDGIFHDIKSNLIDTNRYTPSQILDIIAETSKYRNRFIKSYWVLFKKFFDEYRPTQLSLTSPIWYYFIYQEYGIVFSESHKKNFKEYEEKGYTLDIHGEFTIFKAIMEHDKKSFIALTQEENFDINCRLTSIFYPDSEKGFTLLELCCYHGSVDCFKFLRTEFKFAITPKCLQFSFLGGNPDIMSECLKYIKPGQECMKYAIISHNIDFVSFLINEFGLELDLQSCCVFNNLTCYLIFFDIKHDIDKCFIYSPSFKIFSVFRFFDSLKRDINAKELNSKTALYFAAQFDSHDIAKLLLSQHADFEVKDNEGKTPLHYASKNNCKTTLELLISYGACINEKDYNEKTPLHYAVIENRKDTSDTLIFYSANVNIGDKEGMTVLHYAVQHDDRETADILLKHSANINAVTSSKMTPLLLAAKNNSNEMVKLLISHRADVNSQNSDNDSALHIAAQNENIDLLKLLISNGADINAINKSEKTVLHIAANKNNNDMAAYLVSKNINLDQRDELGYTALHIASSNNNIALVDLLVSHGIKLKLYGKTALHYAAIYGHLENAKYLISKGVNIGCPKVRLAQRSI